MSYPERKYSHLNEFKNQHSHLRHTELIDRTPEWIGERKDMGIRKYSYQKFI